METEITVTVMKAAMLSVRDDGAECDREDDIGSD